MLKVVNLDQRLQNRQQQASSQPENWADAPVSSCAECASTGLVYETRDGVSGVRECSCKIERRQKARIARMPGHYRFADLATMKPRPDIHPDQAQTIAFMREHPTDSYLLMGRQGTGKTFLFWALYRAVSGMDRRVVACSTTQLLDEYRNAIKASDSDERVVVSVCGADLRQNHTRYSLFLDDVDKARPSEYAAEQLFEILDAAYSFEHQVVVTTNLTVEQLVDHFTRADGRYGASIVRRLVDGKQGVEFF